MKHSVRQTEQEFDLALKMMFAAGDPIAMYATADSRCPRCRRCGHGNSVVPTR